MMSRKNVLRNIITASLFFSQVALAAPPSVFERTETLSGRDMASLSLDVGYEYNENEGAPGTKQIQSDEIPVRLRAQITPLLELRAGAIPQFKRTESSSATFLEGAALLNFLPPTPVSPGFGLLLRGIGPVQEETAPHFADLDVRGLMTVSLIDLLIFDLNLGYWFGMGGGSFCELSENVSVCTTSPQHFIPLMAAARVSLFDLLELYVESENYLTLEKGLDDLYSKASMGGEIGLGDSLSLQIGMGFGLTESTESVSIQTGLSWKLFNL